MKRKLWAGILGLLGCGLVATAGALGWHLNRFFGSEPAATVARASSAAEARVLAALQEIPPTLYEAASIDGADGWHQFTRITIPMLRPVLLLVIVLGTIGTWQVFDQVKLLTSGGPLDTTLVPVFLIYSEALGTNGPPQMGYAAAMAFLLAIIIFIFTFVQRRYIESGSEQY
jgi:ABC-type sugar transport system permease subunit